MRGGSKEARTTLSDRARTSDATMYESTRVKPQPSSAAAIATSAELTFKRGDTLTLCRFPASAPNSQGSSTKPWDNPIVSNCAKSAGLRGLPCAAMYAGEAQTTRRTEPTAIAVSEESCK